LVNIFVDLEDIKLLVEKRLSKDEQTKNPQHQLQLVDELIKRRLKPNEGDIKFDALASKSEYIIVIILKQFIIIFNICASILKICYCKVEKNL